MQWYQSRHATMCNTTQLYTSLSALLSETGGFSIVIQGIGTNVGKLMKLEITALVSVTPTSINEV